MGRLVDNDASGEALHKDWFGLLSDEAKADVMKVQIAEHEKTRRTEVEQQEQTRRNRESNADFHFDRGMFIAVLGLVVLGSTCVAYNKVIKSDCPPERPCPTCPTPDAGAPAAR